MARPAKATKDTVFAACELIAAEGVFVTNDNVIARIGGGSKTTVAPFVNEWKETHMSKWRIPDHLLRQIPKDLQKMAERFYTVVCNEAADTVTNEAIEKLEAEVEMYRSQLSELELKIAELKGEKRVYESIGKRNEELAAEINNLKTQLSILQQSR